VSEATATNTRDRLLAVATELVDREGLTQFSLRTVAKRAGVSHGAPYRHFSDRTALLEAVATQGFSHLTSCCALASRTHPGSPERQLREAGACYIRFAVRHPGVIHLMFGGGLDYSVAGEALVRAAESAFAALHGLLAAGVEAGRYRDEDPLHLTYAAWSMAHGLSLLINGGPLAAAREDPAALERLIGTVADSLMYGLLKRNTDDDH